MATLTNLQMRMAAKLLTISATQFVWPKGGEINSLNNLRKRGLVQGDCFGGLQHRHLTEEIKAAFFGENNQTFMIENFHDVGWLIFDDRRYVTNVYSHDDAKRVVTALALLRQYEIDPCQSNTSRRPARRPKEPSNPSQASAS
jgi:hypothetical protein